MKMDNLWDDIFKSISRPACFEPGMLREDVKKLYEKYHNQNSCFGPNGFSFFDTKDFEGDRRYYVYEWFTRDKGKIFYVGKGAGKRYNHIISEIKENTGNQRYSRYLELQENFGIEYRIVADKLTNMEAVIYEKCWILEMLAQGEVLLQYIDIPRKGDRESHERFWTRSFDPIIISDDYRRRYFGVTEVADFDEVNLELLRDSAFLSSPYDSYAYQEKATIRDYVRSCEGAIYPFRAECVKSVIEFCILDYDKYKELKKRGYAVYHSFHVLDFIKTTPPVTLEGTKPWIICEPFFNHNKRDVMRAYLKESESEINKITEESTDSIDLLTRGLQYVSLNSLKDAVIYLEACVRMKIDEPTAYLQLAMIYRERGMFNEEVGVLEQGLAVVSPTNSRISKLDDRLFSAKPLLRWK